MHTIATANRGNDLAVIGARKINGVGKRERLARMLTFLAGTGVVFKTVMNVRKRQGDDLNPVIASERPGEFRPDILEYLMKQGSHFDSFTLETIMKN
jgi:hypothetical protein